MEEKPIMTTLKPARIYGRFSSKPQERGESKRIQIEGGTAWGKANGYEILGVYFDDAITGKTGANFDKELGRLVKDSRAGETVLTILLDRFGRQDPFDLGHYIKQNFIDRDISVLEWKTSEIFTKENWRQMSKKIAAFMKYATSNEENERKIERQKENWQGKREGAKNKPLTACCPDWIKARREPQQTAKGLTLVTVGFDLIKEHAALVKRIFDMSFKGMGNGAITKQLNGEGVASMSKKLARKGIKGGWHTSIIDRILRNPAVLGEYQPQCVTKDGKREDVGEPIKDYYPKVPGITEAMFDALQQKREARKTYGGRRDYKKTIANLFTSICHCGFCGAKMTQVHKRELSLVCDHARRKIKDASGERTTCQYVGYPYQEFETSFLQYVRELDLEEILNSNPDNSKLNTQIELCKGTIAGLQTKIDNLAEMVAGSKSKALVAKLESTEADFEAENQKLKTLMVQLSARRIEVVKIEELKALIQKCQDSKAEDINQTRMAVREAIRGIVKQIKVYPYEICTLDGVEKMTRTERREATAHGYSLTEDVQRVLRGYDIYFKNEDTYRSINSHPKYGKGRTAKLVLPPALKVA